MSRSRTVRLSVPERHRESPDFCDGTPGGIADWLAALPFADPALAARELLAGLGELNACTTAFGLRFRQLELLRSTVHLACGGIARRAENRSVLRAESERREAGLAQRVQFQLALGYKMVIVDALRDGVHLAVPTGPENDAELVMIAIHRALTELTRTLLRSLQFYAPPPRRLWSQLHQLYYLEDWTRVIGIAPTERAREPVILVNLHSDQPPVRVSHYRHVAGEEPRSLETGGLVVHLNAFLEEQVDAQAPLARLDAGNENLIRHGSQVWGENTERAHPRRSAPGRGGDLRRHGNGPLSRGRRAESGATAPAPPAGRRTRDHPGSLCRRIRHRRQPCPRPCAAA